LCRDRAFEPWVELDRTPPITVRRCRVAAPGVDEAAIQVRLGELRAELDRSVAIGEGAREIGASQG
jgi:hypothetical protein